MSGIQSRLVPLYSSVINQALSKIALVPKHITYTSQSTHQVKYADHHCINMMCINHKYKQICRSNKFKIDNCINSEKKYAYTYINQ